jgi:hypothetical protein
MLWHYLFLKSYMMLTDPDECYVRNISTLDNHMVITLCLHLLIDWSFTTSNTAWVRAQLSKLQKWYTQHAAASDKVYQLLAEGRWFSPGTSVSSTNKTDHHDITEKLLKVALNTITLTLNPEEDWVALTNFNDVLRTLRLNVINNQSLTLWLH